MFRLFIQGIWKVDARARARIFNDSCERRCDSFSRFCMSNASNIQIITIFGFGANIYRSYLLYAVLTGRYS